MSEHLVFDSVELTGPIEALDLAPLRNFATRGRNTVMPMAPGTRANTVILDQLDETITWLVTGRFDPDGNVHPDREVGTAENMEHYRALFTAGGLHTIALHFAGEVFTATGVQMAGYSQTRTGPYSATLLTRLVIPAGVLEEDSS